MILNSIEIPKHRLLYYYRNNYSNNEIAQTFKCSADLIRKRLKLYGVYENAKKNNEEYNTKKALVKCLKRKGYSNEFISEKLKDGFKKVYKYIKISADNFLSDDLNNTTTFEKSVIVGTFLGDASISKVNVFNFEHSTKQEEYFFWKTQLLTSLNLTVTKSKRDYINPCMQNTESLTCTTNSTNDFIKWLNEISYKPKKIITQELLEYYTTVSLALHFQDDGAKRGSGYLICTECFDIDSVNLLVLHLKNKFDLDCSLDNERRIYIGAKNKNKFTELVKPFIHKSMSYKLHDL
jgi:predicted DNA-binding protein YlxM (UPF0122 family)